MNLSTVPQPRLAIQALGAQIPPLVDTLKLHRLKTPAQIATVMHLRNAIDLSVHVAAGQDFVRLEKKETNSGSCWASSSMVS